MGSVSLRMEPRKTFGPAKAVATQGNAVLLLGSHPDPSKKCSRVGAYTPPHEGLGARVKAGQLLWRKKFLLRENGRLGAGKVAQAPLPHSHEQPF